MNLFKRVVTALGSTGPEDKMAISYPSAALEGVHAFHTYPPKFSLKEQGVFAYQLEFAAFEADAYCIMDVIVLEFGCSNQAPLQEGHARRRDKSVHFSIRREFGAVVVVLITNSLALIQKIDDRFLEPPPPWFAFPHVDPSTMGSLQGSMEYWWDRLFSPFWNALDADARASYLARYSANGEWSDFLSARAST